MKMYKSGEFKEINSGIHVTSYTYKGCRIDVDDQYQGGYEILVDGDHVGYFNTENFKTADKIPVSAIDEYIDDGYDSDYEPTADALWVNGYLDDELDEQMWEEFHKTVERKAKEYIEEMEL